MTPYRSVPRPRISQGIVTSATAIGTHWLSRLPAAFLASSPPAVSSDAPGAGREPGT